MEKANDNDRQKKRDTMQEKAVGPEKRGDRDE